MRSAGRENALKKRRWEMMGDECLMISGKTEAVFQNEEGEAVFQNEEGEAMIRISVVKGTITCPFCLLQYDVSSVQGFASFLDHSCFSELAVSQSTNKRMGGQDSQICLLGEIGRRAGMRCEFY